MNKWLKYSIRFVVSCIAILVVAWGILYLYFRSHKAEILEQAIATIGNKIHGKVKIKDVGIGFFKTFPNASVVLEDVSIEGPLFALHQQELLKAEKLLLLSNPFKMLSGKLNFTKLQVEKGSIYLYEDSLGHKSLDAFKNTKEAKNKHAVKASIEKIRLVDMRITIDQPYKHKRYDLNIKNLTTDIDQTGQPVRFGIDIDAVIKQLSFKTEKGIFAENQTMKGKFELQYDTASHILSFHDITIKLSDEPYQFSGNFKLTDDKLYTLAINAPAANFSKARALLPFSIRKNIDSIDIPNPLKVTTTIKGSLIPGTLPLVYATWLAHNTPVNTPFGHFKNAELDGFYHNRISDTLPPVPENAGIQFNNFTGILDGISIHSKKISITNLKKPVLHCDITSAANLDTFDNSLGSDAIEFTKGTININLLFEGPIYDSATDAVAMNGQIQIRNAGIIYSPRQIRLDNFSGDLVFKGTDVFFNNINATAQGSSVVLNISALNLLSVMNSDPTKAHLTAHIFSPYLDINKLTSFVGNRTKRGSRKGRGKLRHIAVKIDKVLEQCSIQSHIDAQKIIFKKFVATNVKSDITLSNDLYALNNTSLNFGGGTIKMSGYVKETNKNFNPFNVKVTMNNLNVDKTFYAFDNFGMSSLSSKNLKGKLSSNINITAALKENAALVPSSVKGTIFFSLKNGEINNWEPLEKMSFFLFKNRDFSHVAFSEIKDNIEIDGGHITFNRMEIQSTILSLFIGGLYDLGGKNTNLVIELPLNNLKKRKPDFDLSKSNGKGKSVYVTVKNKTGGDIDFGLKLSNKDKK